MLANIGHVSSGSNTLSYFSLSPMTKKNIWRQKETFDWKPFLSTANVRNICSSSLTLRTNKLECLSPAGLWTKYNNCELGPDCFAGHFNWPLSILERDLKLPWTTDDYRWPVWQEWQQGQVWQQGQQRAGDRVIKLFFLITGAPDK